MPFVFKRLALFLSIAAAFAADKEASQFRPAPASTYPHRQTNGQVTIAADPYNTGSEKIKTAFGKVDPNQYGVLPVLVVIQNDSAQTIKVDGIKAEYVGPLGERFEATPSKDVKFVNGPNRPRAFPGPPGHAKVLRNKKNPLDVWEIEGRAMVAQLVPAGNTASGFFYFDMGDNALQKGSTIYLTGLTEAGSGKALLFFEIPLQ
jgi:hypothetical protein